jgi:hypothetical protein
MQENGKHTGYGKISWYNYFTNTYIQEYVDQSPPKMQEKEYCWTKNRMVLPSS